jgi:hypothetical protein
MAHYEVTRFDVTWNDTVEVSSLMRERAVFTPV